jgi:hypothetical protein
LFHLSKGVRVAELSQYVPLAPAAIEKRLSNLREVLDMQQASDTELVQEAKNKGII